MLLFYTNKTMSLQHKGPDYCPAQQDRRPTRRVWVSQNDEFCIIFEELCIINDESFRAEMRATLQLHGTPAKVQ